MPLPTPGVIAHFLSFYIFYGLFFIVIMLGFCRIPVRCAARYWRWRLGAILPTDALLLFLVHRSATTT